MSHLSGVFGDRIYALSELDIHRLRLASEVGDVETVSKILKISPVEAARVVAKYAEYALGRRVKDTLCTPDSRQLLQDILGILSRYLLTKVGRERIRLLTPSLDRREVESRLLLADRAVRLLEWLDREGRLSRVTDLLSGAVFESVKAGKPPLLAVTDRGLYEEVLERFGAGARVELVESREGVADLLRGGDVVLLLGGEAEGSGLPGVISMPATPESIDVDPEAFVNYFLERRRVVEAAAALVSQLEGSGSAGELFDVDARSLTRTSSILKSLEATREPDLESTLFEAQERLNEEAKRIADRGGGAKEFREALDEALFELTNSFRLDREEQRVLHQAAYEQLSVPFEFSPVGVRALVSRHTRRLGESRYFGVRKAAAELWSLREAVDRGVESVFRLDYLLAVARFAKDFRLKPARINGGAGIGFLNAANLLLLDEEARGRLKVERVSYTVGSTEIKIPGAGVFGVAMLTGANSGGKTTLLLTIAAIHIMTILGLPVPADEAEVPLLPLYLFRRRTTRKAGSLEHAVHSLAPVFADPEPKILLIDEFEALTEPISAGRMVASIVNRVSLSNCLTVFVTHLAREALPHVKVKIRVDGIEASGVDASGELIVERQPRFNHVGTSTPELVIRRLHMKARNRRVRALYVEMMGALGERGQVLQTPISLPWIERAKNGR